jgi:hypothetical protein
VRGRLGRLCTSERFAKCRQLGVVQASLNERKEHAFFVTDVALEQAAETGEVADRGLCFVGQAGSPPTDIRVLREDAVERFIRGVQTPQGWEEDPLFDLEVSLGFVVPESQERASGRRAIRLGGMPERVRCGESVLVVARELDERWVSLHEVSGVVPPTAFTSMRQPALSGSRGTKSTSRAPGSSVSSKPRVMPR